MIARVKPRYQEPPDDLREVLWEQGHIRPWQLLRIVAWKPVQGLAWLSLNSPDAIIDQTEHALATLRPYKDRDVVVDPPDWDAWQSDVGIAIGSSKKSGLLALEGVGYPVATAVLAVLAPCAFPVIDRYVVEAVFGPDAVGKKRQWQTKAAYRAYAEFLATSCNPELVGLVDVHERDQRVMNSVINTRPLKGFGGPIALPPR